MEAISAKALDPFALKIPELTDQFVHLIDAFAKWPVIKDAIDSLANMLDTLMHPGKLLNNLGAGFSGVADWMIGGDPLGIQSSASWFTGKLGGLAHGVEANHLGAYMSFLDLSRNIGSGALEMVSAIESAGNPKAVGPNTPWGTAKGQFGLLDMNSKGIDPFDPVASAERAASLLYSLMREFHGDRLQTMAAYHSGASTVEAAIAQYGANWRQGLGPKGQEYVHKVEIYLNNQTGGSTVAASSQVSGR